MKWKDKKKKHKQHTPQKVEVHRLDAIRERTCCETCWKYFGSDSTVSRSALSNAHFCDACLEIVIEPESFTV